MKREFIAKTNRNNAVRSLFKEKKNIISSNPAVEKSVELFNTKLATLDTTMDLENEEISGVGADKLVLKRLVSREFSQKAGIIHAWAFENNDHTIMEATDVSESMLYNMPDSTLAKKCAHIYKLAVTHQQELKARGIDDTVLLAMNNLLNSFIDDHTKPRRSIANRSSYGGLIEVQHREIDHIFENSLNKVMPLLEDAHPDFYAAYLINREVVGIGSRQTRVSGFIGDDKSGSALKGVLVRAVSGENIFTTNTDANGQFAMKITIPGVYTFEYIVEGYLSPAPEEVEIKLGKKKVRTVWMNKA